MEELIEKLKDMGFNTYEAKVYLALLKQHPATGYEVSKESGVPQARAYDTLKALESSGIVASLGGKPTTYMPTAPDELIARWERSFNSSVSVLKEALPSLSSETVEPILNLRGTESIIRHVEEMIANATESIFVEIWKEDAVRFGPALTAAAKRGVAVKIVGYNDAEIPGCDVYPHGKAKTIEDDLGGRWLIISVDNTEGLIGNLPAGEKVPGAVYTRNQGIVFIIKELVVHDIFLLDVEKNLGDAFEKVYGSDSFRLRNKVFGNQSIVVAHH